MIQMSLSEKIKILVDVSKSSGINIISILILIFMAFLFLTTNKKNAKKSKKIYKIIYIILIGVILFVYNSSLSTMFDYMMNNFFIGFYFPNLAIYLAAIILTNIVLLKTIFNFREDKLLKRVNVSIYCIIHYILILILGIINSNKLDVFDQTSIYNNNEVAGLISLSSTIFIVWIIFLTVYKMIRKSQKKHQKVKIPVRKIITYKKKMPSNYLTINVPEEVFGVVNKTTYVDSNILEFYNTEKIEKEKYESMFTLDDYKKMADILKSDKKYIRDVIPIEEYEATKEETVNDMQPKLEELLNLYKSI